MTTGLIPISQPSNGPVPVSGPEAKIAPKTKGSGELFSDHVYGPNGGSQVARPEAIKLDSEPQQGSDLSQASADVAETLMRHMQVDNKVSGLSETDLLEDRAPDSRDLDQLLQQTPGLAFIAGRLEFLQPQQIPQTVTASKFIQSALAASDINEFMNSPQTIGELMNALQLPSDMKQQLAQLGVDLTTVVTPERLLTKIGLDPGVVASEMQMLRDNMQLDGLTAYMERAARLNRSLVPQVTEGGVGPVERTNVEAISSGTAVHSHHTLSGERDAMALTDRRAQDILSSELNQSQLSPRLRDTGISNQSLQAERVGFDPTQDIQRAMDELSSSQKTIIPTQAQTVRVSSKDPIVQPDELSFQNASGAMQTGAQSHQNVQATMEQIFADQLMGRAGIEQARGMGEHSGGSASDQGFQKEGAFELGSDQLKGTNLASNQSHKADFLSTLQSTEVNDTPKAVQKEIVERAQVLVKDGGGLVKLNIGSGHERIELAMTVENDSVNLKILTNSDQVKDILANDIPKLREALNQQDLQLNEVQLGSHSKREWSNGSFDQGAFQKEYAEQREQLNEQPGKITKSASSMYSGVSIEHLSAARPRHAGQIQVFA